MSEYAAFIGAMRAGRKMRERMFDTIEQRHAHDLRSGDDGRQLYEGLLSAIRDSGDPEAVEEFESRFFPLVDPDNPSRETDTGPREEVSKEDRAENQRHGSWAWASAACVAAIVLAALLGFNGLRMKTADRPSLAGSPIPAAHATVSSQPTSETAVGAAAETSIHADDAAELATPEAMTGPAQPPAVELEPDPER